MGNQRLPNFDSSPARPCRPLDDSRRDIVPRVERPGQNQGFASVARADGFDESQFLGRQDGFNAGLALMSFLFQKVAEQRLFAPVHHRDQVGGLCHQLRTGNGSGAPRRIILPCPVRRRT